jgi:hypothetical protein
MKMNASIRKSAIGFLLLAGLVTGTVSCKKDKDENPAPPPPVATEKIKEFKTGEEFIKFEYANDGAVNKVIINSDVNTGGTSMTYNITYNGTKIAGLETATEKIVPVYDNNVMTRADIFQNNEKVGYTAYSYENNALKRATIYYGEGTEFNPIFEFNFAYNAAGNVTENVAMIANGEPGQMVRSGHVTYQYDEKTNPLYSQKQLLALFWQVPSKNNITVENHFDADQQPEDKFVYNYTYNSNGLPKSAVVTEGLPGQPQVTSTVQYVY